MRRGFRVLALAALLVAAAIACGVPDYAFAPGSSPVDAAADAGPAPSDAGLVDADPGVDAFGVCGDASVLYGGHCYRFTTSQLPCKDACGINSELAVFETEEELVAIADAMGPPPNGRRYYIGLVAIDGDSGRTPADFRWVNGAPVTYARWAQGQPSGEPDRACVLLDVLADATAAPPPAWFDHQGSDPRFALCERVP